MTPNGSRSASPARMLEHTNGLLSRHDLALVDAVAVRVLELLDARQAGASPGLVDPATLAEALGVSRSTVYEHAAELGAVEVGTGSRPRLRFDAEKARAAWNRRSGSEGSQGSRSPAVSGVRSRRRPDRLGSTVRLLPIKGEEAA